MVRIQPVVQADPATIHETFVVPLDELRGFSARCIGKEHPIRAAWYSDRVSLEMNQDDPEGLANVCVRYRKR